MEHLQVDRPHHGHHKVAAAIFVASLILGSALVLSAELMKPERYEFHPGTAPNTYIIYDRETGRATSADTSSKNPTDSLKNWSRAGAFKLNRNPSTRKSWKVNMLILSTIALPLAAIGYSLVYLLGGGGFLGAIVIFLVAKMLGDWASAIRLPSRSYR
jgi:hypothetical protein